MFESDRLRFTVITKAHASEVFDTLNYQKTAEMISFLTWPMTLEQAQSWCQKSEEGIKSHREFLYLAHSKKTNEPVGCICLLIEDDTTKAEIGLWIAEPWQGKGIATEMIRAIAEFAFQHLQLKKLIAKVAKQNPASRRAVEKIGFVSIGHEQKPTAKGTTLEMTVFELRCDD
jgi:[ribosomal protein S5]-alanine N-acetyltransferase